MKKLLPEACKECIKESANACKLCRQKHKSDLQELKSKLDQLKAENERLKKHDKLNPQIQMGIPDDDCIGNYQD